jgi:hypothetical protein
MQSMTHSERIATTFGNNLLSAIVANFRQTRALAGGQSQNNLARVNPDEINSPPHAGASETEIMTRKENSRLQITRLEAMNILPAIAIAELEKKCD